MTNKLDFVKVLSTFLVVVFCLLIIIPFWISIVTSLTTNTSYAIHPVQFIPKTFTLENYKYLLNNSTILIGYKNTLFIVIVGTVYSLTVSLTMAYGLSQKSFPGKKFFTLFMIVPMYVTGGVIPIYLQMKNLGLLNNLWGIILLCGISPFNMILLKNGIEQQPYELVEAAKIDGAGELRIFIQIVIPLLKPILATVALFTVVTYWNEWFWSTLSLTSANSGTLQSVLRAIVCQNDAMSMTSTMSYASVFQQGIKMAAVVVIMLPIMLVYPFVQKYFTKGIMIGAVKM